MVLACAAPDASAPLVQGLAAYLGCHAGGIGELGYQAFAGSALLAGLQTSCMTLYVALFGYRLLLGQRFQFRDAVVAVLRVGVIITFAMHWSSYQAVVYNLVVQGPAELAGVVLQPEGLSVATGAETARRLESTYEALEQSPFTVPPSATGTPLLPGTVVMPAVAAAPAGAVVPRPTLNPGGVLLMISTLGPLAALQIAAGMLLALGPIVILLALFDPFVGVLEGWLRALGGTFVGGFALAIVLALELDFFDAEVANATTAAHNDADVFAAAAMFGILVVGVLVAAIVTAIGFRIPRRTGGAPTLNSRRSIVASQPAFLSAHRTLADRPLAPSRAQVIAGAVALRRQPLQSLMRLEAGAALSSGLSESIKVGGSPPGAFQPLGYNLRSPAAPKRGLGIARRNRR